MNDPERLLVRAPNWIGDVVLSLPALRDLRRRFPTARLEVLARPWVGELYQAVSPTFTLRTNVGDCTAAVPPCAMHDGVGTTAPSSSESTCCKRSGVISVP